MMEATTDKFAYDTFIPSASVDQHNSCQRAVW